MARKSNARVIAAVNGAAHALGLAPGLPLQDARARVPGIEAHDHDPEADAGQLQALADWCDRFTPLVGLDGGRGLILDMTGALHLFGGEAALLPALLARLAAQGFRARGAIASHPAIARAIAAYGAGGCVPPAAEAELVAGLPVEALRQPEAIRGLRQAGLTTVGLTAAQPRAGLAARFGKPLVDALDRLAGRLDQPISPRRLLPDCLAERHFPEPIATAEVVASLTADICTLLETSGDGAHRFEARLFRTEGRIQTLEVATARASRDAAAINRLMRLRLDSLNEPLDAGFGYDLIRLEAHGRQRLDPVAVTLDRRAEAEADLDALIDRLSIRFGADNVLRPVGHGSHVPERAAAWVPARDWRAPETGDSGRLASLRLPGEAPPRPSRLFRHPQPIDVMAEVPDGPPLRFRWRRMLHEVAHAEGPERIAPEWWHEPEAPTRDYFRIEDAFGRRFWLYRAGLYDDSPGAPRWFLHGVF